MPPKKRRADEAFQQGGEEREMAIGEYKPAKRTKRGLPPLVGQYRDIGVTADDLGGGVNPVDISGPFPKARAASAKRAPKLSQVSTGPKLDVPFPYADQPLRAIKPSAAKTREVQDAYAADASIYGAQGIRTAVPRDINEAIREAVRDTPPPSAVPEPPKDLVEATGQPTSFLKKIIWAMTVYKKTLAFLGIATFTGWMGWKFAYLLTPFFRVGWSGLLTQIAQRLPNGPFAAWVAQKAKDFAIEVGNKEVQSRVMTSLATEPVQWLALGEAIGKTHPASKAIVDVVSGLLYQLPGAVSTAIPAAAAIPVAGPALEAGLEALQGVVGNPAQSMFPSAAQQAASAESVIRENLTPLERGIRDWGFLPGAIYKGLSGAYG